MNQLPTIIETKNHAFNEVLSNKTAPTGGITTNVTNPVGAVHSTIPANHLDYILSYPVLMSNKDVDNQKPRISEVIGSVEDRGFAPLDSQVVSRGRHYASPTVSAKYQISKHTSRTSRFKAC